MKKTGRVLCLNSLKLDFLMKLDRVRASLCILSAAGLLTGILLFSVKNSSFDIAKTVFGAIFKFKTGDNFAIAFLIASGIFLSVILLQIIFGSSVFGVIVVPLSAFSINCIFGMTLAYSYNTYKLSGLAFNSILLIPTFAIFLFGFIVSSSALLNYSICQLKNLSKKRNSKDNADFSAMLKKQLFASLIMLFNALLEVILNHIFIANFNF